MRHSFSGLCDDLAVLDLGNDRQWSHNENTKARLNHTRVCTIDSHLYRGNEYRSLGPTHLGPALQAVTVMSLSKAVIPFSSYGLALTI
jgi:hypothetical protein